MMLPVQVYCPKRVQSTLLEITTFMPILSLVFSGRKEFVSNNRHGQSICLLISSIDEMILGACCQVDIW